jgi:phosphoribosylglycinamide formyltransferase-1
MIQGSDGSSQTHRLGILLSGRGSNFLAIAEGIAQGRVEHAEIAVVISNRSNAPGIAAARSAGFATQVIEARGRQRSEHDAEIIASLQAHLSAEFVRAFPQRILNIHPSLLPAFPGLDAQSQALAYGVTVSGCTVHFVDEELDHGVIVLQKTVPVLPEDDEPALAARILAQEHLSYTEAIARVLSGKYRIAGRRYIPIR